MSLNSINRHRMRRWMFYVVTGIITLGPTLQNNYAKSAGAFSALVIDPSSTARGTTSPATFTVQQRQGQFDFNGDGKADLLWYNAATGQTAISLMNGTDQLNSAVVSTDPNLRFTASADLNGDGKTDLLWYNAATGQTSAWLMEGAGVTSTAVLLTDPNVTVIAGADLNGDGKDDLVWYNAATGQTSAWLMNGLVRLNSVELFTDPNWKPSIIGR